MPLDFFPPFLPSSLPRNRPRPSSLLPPPESCPATPLGAPCVVYHLGTGRHRALPPSPSPALSSSALPSPSADRNACGLRFLLWAAYSPHALLQHKGISVGVEGFILIRNAAMELLRAAEAGNTRMLQLMLQSGADVDFRDPEVDLLSSQVLRLPSHLSERPSVSLQTGRTALHAAAKHGRLKEVKMMVEAFGASCNIRDDVTAPSSVAPSISFFPSSSFPSSPPSSPPVFSFGPLYLPLSLLPSFPSPSSSPYCSIPLFTPSPSSIRSCPATPYSAVPVTLLSV